MENRCEKCKHKDKRGWEKPCSICMVARNGEESMFEPKTNADRIRSMTDEELAEFLKGIDNGHEIVMGYYFYTKKYAVMMSSDKVLEWLQKDSEV